MKNTDQRNGESRFQPQKKNIKRELWNWVMDGEKRGTLNWIATFIGGAFIVGYYLSLDVSFTPNVDLGQATLLLVQAFLLGIVLVGYLCAVSFGPAIAYRWLGIGAKLFAQDIPLPIRYSLFVRNLAAQVLAAALFILGSLAIANDTDIEKWHVDLFIAGIAAVISFATLLGCKRFSNADVHENMWEYWGSIVLVGCLGLLSFFVVWLLHAIPHQEPDNSRWWAYVMWLAVAMFSAIFSIVNNRQWKTVFLFAISVFFMILATFGVISWPAKTVAAAIGIAERDPVTLIFPDDTCKAVAKVISKSKAFFCEGDQSGVLHNVLLRNSLGDRWVMQEAENAQSIVFDGKDVIVVKPAKVARQNKVAITK